MKKVFLKPFVCVAALLALLTLFSACGLDSSGDGDYGDDGYYGNNYDDGMVDITYYLNIEGDETAYWFSAHKSSQGNITPPERDGYLFAGLYTSAQGGDQIFDESGNTLVLLDQDMTLWAHWTPRTYTLTFDAGEGTFTTAETERPVLYGTELSSFPAVMREGYTFVGWKNASGTVISDGAQPLAGHTVFDLNSYPVDSEGESSLTAVFELKMCSVTFDYGNGNEETQIFSWGSPTLHIEYPMMDTGSSEIISWSVMPNVQMDLADETIKNDVTLYAIWRDYKVFTFNLGADMEPLTARVYNGVNFKAPEPEKNGYSFAGWYTSDLYSGLPEQSISYHSYSSTFYAKWNLEIYTLNFESNGGTGDLTPLNFDFENTLALPTVTKENCIFLGWCRNEDLSDAPMTELPTGSYGNTKLYAKYEGPRSSINLDGGNGLVSVNTFTVEYSAWNYLPVPKYDGYLFRGWYLGDTQMTDSNGKTLTIWNETEGGLTLTAKYAKAYKVTVLVNDAYGIFSEMDDAYAEGDSVVLSLVLANGWTLESLTSNLGMTLQPGAIFTMPAKDVTIEAVVKPNSYKVTLSAGADAYLKTDSITLNMNDVVTLPTPAKQGHSFEGWYYGTEQITDAGGRLVSTVGWNIASDTVLTAKFVSDGNTYQFIQSGDDLYKMKENPNGKYRLVCDIIVTNWETIHFAGVLDGGGYTISGIQVALFGTMTGTVENLTVEYEINATDYSANRYGGVVCELKDNGIVRNVTAKGTLTYTSGADVGGIVGFKYGGNTVIIGCVNYACVNATAGWSVGGIVGAMNSANTCTDNVNYGAVTNVHEAGGNVGGISGYCNQDGAIQNCVNYGTLQGAQVGGIIGYVESGKLTVDNCLVNAEMQATSALGRYVGLGGNRVTYMNLPDVTVSNTDEFIQAVQFNVSGENIILLADISLAGINWTPVEFYGNLIGNGYKIKDLNLTSGEKRVGLFSYMTGSVENLILQNFVIVSNASSGCPAVGALCGYFEGVSVKNVTLESGSITAGVSDCGGLLGYLMKGDVTGCTNRASVTADSTSSGGCTGGVVGYMPGGTLSDCVNYGTVKGVYRTGGICGGMNIKGENFYRNMINNGPVAGTDKVGGILGEYNSGTLTLDTCVSNGSITATGAAGRYVGNNRASYKNLPVTTVSTREQFLAMSLHVAGDTFILKNDISLSGMEWKTLDFSAALDGEGHTLTGLTVPLFGILSGSITNLEVHFNIEDTSSSHIGGVACTMSTTSSVTNVTTRGSISKTGNGDIGGITGSKVDNATVSGCTNYATVTSNNGNAAGGLVGSMTNSANCNGNRNYGDLSNPAGYAGGIAGWVGGANNTLTECRNEGNITGKFAGGIIGRQNGGTTTIDNCANTGEVVGTANTGKFVASGGVAYQNLPIITITTAEQLQAMKLHVVNEIYELGADIDLSDVEWIPYDFSATLDGKGYRIIGQKTNIFNKVTGAVKNMTLDAVNIEVDFTGVTAQNVAALALEVSGSAVIENITAYGTIRATASCGVGGIIRTANNTSVIRNCTNHIDIQATVTSDSYQIGGVVSAIASGHAVVLENCNNYGDISGNYNVGGILGWYNGSVAIKNCNNYGLLTCAHRTGGIVGYAARAVTIDGCGFYGVFGEGSVFGKYVGAGSASYQNLPTMEISTPEELLEMILHISAESYVLTADIDMSGIEWTPFAFTAKLDGNGHKISGIEISSAEGNLGIFTTVSGIIENLIFDNINVQSTSYTEVLVGGVCYELTGGTLKNITVTGSVTAESGRIAGLVAKQSSGTIENCENRATVTSNMTAKEGSAAGVVGWFAGGTLNDCRNYGTITKKHYTGGVIGYMTSFGIGKLTNYGKISGEYDTGGVVGLISVSSTVNLKAEFSNEGEVIGVENVGGVVGRLSGSNGYDQTLTLNHLTNSSPVTGDTYVGGIFGYFHIYADRSYNSPVFKATLTDIFNTGDVSGVSHVGGIVGYGYTDTGSSTFTGLTSTADIRGEYYVGGIAGKLEYIVLNSCSNAGSTVSSDGYQINNSVYYTYLGGYVGYGYGLVSCTNAVEINHTQKGSYVGGLAGYLYENAISCTNSAKVSAAKCDYVGGLAGKIYRDSSATMHHLTNTGAVEGGSYTGGIAGYLNASNDYDQTLTLNVFENSGTVTGTNYAGGIIGYLHAYADRSYNEPVFKILISEFNNTGDVTGTSYVGGLIGYGYSDTGSSAITDSQSSADISAEYYVGGLTGKVEYIQINSCSNAGSTVTATAYFIDGSLYYTYLGGYAGIGYSFSDCINDMELSYTLKGSYVGGIAGYVNGSVNTCVNNADITASKCDYVGGIVGYSYLGGGSTLNDNENAGEITGNNFVGGIAGRMQCFNDYDQTLSMNSFENSGTVSGNDYTAGIIGYLYAYADRSYNSPVFTILISEFKNSGDISGLSHTGGLIGYGYSDTGSSKISGSISSANIIAEHTVGGLAGKLENICLESCDNAGSTVTATAYYIDGSSYFTYLGGYVGYGYLITDCHNTIDLSYEIKGSYVGGLAGFTQTVPTSCTNAGNIYAPQSNFVGGLAGYANAAWGMTSENDKNTGNVTGIYHVGGLFGKIYGSNGYDQTLTLKKYTNSGTVTGVQHVGGIAGEIYTYADRSYNSPIFTVTASEFTNTGAITGEEYVGGFVGVIYTDSGNSALTGHVSTGTVAFAESVTGTYISETFAQSTNFKINE